MADERENLVVSLGDEIRCLLDAGWTWDGDKLVYPQDKDVWTRYKRVDSNKIRHEQFEWEIEKAVRKARRQEQVDCRNLGGRAALVSPGSEARAEP